MVKTIQNNNTDNSMVAPGVTFVKGKQVEHVQIYKNLTQYRLRFGINGGVFFRKPLIITKLRESGIAKNRAQATDHLENLIETYKSKGFKKSWKLKDATPTKRAYYLLTKRSVLKRSTVQKRSMAF